VGEALYIGDSVAILLMEAHAMAYDMEGDGVPLVFIHQVATDRRLWHHQRLSLHRRYRVITLDLLGHGEVAWPPHEFSLESAASRVHTLLTEVNAEPGFVIGVSMGAAIAMRLALHDPGAVRGLILISPWGQMSEHTRNLVDRLFRLAERGEMAMHTELFLRYVLPTSYLERHPHETERLRALAMDQPAKAVAYTWAACLASDLTGKLGDIRMPALVIAGLHDLFAPPYLARAVAESLADVEFEVWDETGHFPFVEDPARFNRRLETFVRRCLAQAHAE
jgi:pimeloyl-ACP methyl ester carboxylesterase